MQNGTYILAGLIILVVVVSIVKFIVYLARTGSQPRRGKGGRNNLHSHQNQDTMTSDGYAHGYMMGNIMTGSQGNSHGKSGDDAPFTFGASVHDEKSGGYGGDPGPSHHESSSDGYGDGGWCDSGGGSDGGGGDGGGDGGGGGGGD